MVERGPGGFEPNTHPSDLLLSDYLLGEVDDPTVARSIEEHLAACDTCRQVLAELGEVVRLLDQLPDPDPPRSFRLTPEMAGIEGEPADRRLLRLVPAIRWAGLIAAVFLVALLVTDAVIHHSTSPQTASVPAVAFSTASSASSASESSSNAVVPASTAASRTMQAFGAASTTEAAGGAAAKMASPAAAPALVSTPSSSESMAGAASQAPRSTETPATDRAAKAATASEAASPLARAATGRAGPSGTTHAGIKTLASTAWRWHLAELALALLVIWLLMLSVVLPRWRHTRS